MTWAAVILGLSSLALAAFPLVRPFFPFDPRTPAETLARASREGTSPRWLVAHYLALIGFVLRHEDQWRIVRLSCSTTSPTCWPMFAPGPESSRRTPTCAVSRSFISTWLKEGGAVPTSREEPDGSSSTFRDPSQRHDAARFLVSCEAAMARSNRRTIGIRAERKVNDTDARLWHPWLDINRVLRAAHTAGARWLGPWSVAPAGSKQLVR